MTGQVHTKLRDLALPLVIVAVVGMMVFPLPAAVLDALLMCNIAFALSLLISSVYLSDSGKFTSLPTVLLLATLFRLGLNISTTRQLLSHGEAPQIVNAFGNFVVSGNLVVGVVIFFIVTLVQFLVIAKGAERIAEVAARFTLDAMPGKQMAIDADVRAGLIGFQAAKEKRQELHRESKLYGALDGAMKFVKGDAIAGLVITIVNIVGGLVVGTTQQGLTLSEALSKYTLFTIGDGLVSQIPALLVAVAAGISVTRVEAKEHSFVGRELVAQLFEQPQAMATTGVVLGFLSCVPGLPILPFAAGGLIFLTASFITKEQRQRERKIHQEGDFLPKIYSAVVLNLSSEAAQALQKENVLPEQIRNMREQIFSTTGVLVPDLQFEVSSTLLGKSAEILLQGVVVGAIDSNNGVERSEFTGPKKSIVFETQQNFTSHICGSVRAALKRRLPELIDDTHTRTLLELHRPQAEDLINNVIPNIASVTTLTSVLRQLVKEQVSIRDIKGILQAIAEFHLSAEQGVVANALRPTMNRTVIFQLRELAGIEAERSTQGHELIAEVRQALRRVISSSIADSNWQLRAHVVAPELDLLLSQSAISGAPLDPELVSRLYERIEGIIQNQEQRLIVLCSSYARILLSELLIFKDFNAKAIAVTELCEEVELSIEGNISLEPEGVSLDNIIRPEFGSITRDEGHNSAASN